MRQVTFLLIALLLLTSCHFFTQPQELEIRSLTYSYNNGTVPPVFQWKHENTFGTAGLLHHKKYVQGDSVALDHMLQIGTDFINAVNTMIQENDFAAMKERYAREGFAGGKNRWVDIKTNLYEKSIMIYAQWGDSLPKPLWDLEVLVNAKIREVDAGDQPGAF